MALTINEKWVRERVHLNPENLDDVRSLALPGSYHEKITHLGTSLQNFSRLKHLDVSRNALQSLDGLQHLTVLERLNIYYNNIGTLKELFRLRSNTSLQEVDLRLNPVTKNEPDYRLFMVHMLPNLRKLDDRSVRESERKAALMHFTSDQASDMTDHLPMKRQGETDRVINPRADMVANMPRKVTVLDDDECDVLDLIARTGGDLGRPREITGSMATIAKVTSHSYADRSDNAQSDVPRDRPASSGELLSTKYPPSPAVAPSMDGTRRTKTMDDDQDEDEDESMQGHASREARPQDTEQQQQQQQQWAQPSGKERVRVQFDQHTAGDMPTHANGISDLGKYIDESQAYTAYTSRGHFTPHPDTNSDSGQSQESSGARGGHLEQVIPHQTEPDRVTCTSTQRPSPTPEAHQVPASDRVDLNLFLDNFLSLVDRYWNGTKSLHRHGKFQSQAHTLLATLTNEVTASVPQPRQEIPKESPAEIRKLRQTLKTTQDQVENLRVELDTARADRRQLQESLDAVAHNDRMSGDRSGDRSADSQQTARGTQSGREIEKLTRENEGLKLHVKHFNQLQELAAMLQESHKSLVTTNDHLLQELDETKQRHLEEVKQLHWSYGELKRTMDLAPSHQHGAKGVEQSRYHASSVM